MKEKLKSYEFWVSIVSAVMVVLQSLSLKFDLPYIQESVTGFLVRSPTAWYSIKSKPGPADSDRTLPVSP